MTEEMKKAQGLLSQKMTETKRKLADLQVEVGKQQSRIDTLYDAMDILDKCSTVKP